MHAHKPTNADVDEFQILSSCSQLDLCCITASCREMFYHLHPGACSWGYDFYQCIQGLLKRSRRWWKQHWFCCFWLCIMFWWLKALSHQRRMALSPEPRYTAQKSKFSLLLWRLFNQASSSLFSVCSEGTLNKYQNKFSQNDGTMFPQSFCD